LGGLAVTRERDGYRFDRTGHWLHLRDAGIKKLVAETLPDQMVEVTRKARIFSHGATTLYPFQANLYGLPPEVVKECLLGVMQAKLQPAGSAPLNFEEYCLRHFGAGISKHFMIPYNERLWGVSPREITADWCSRFVPLPSLEQVVGGAVGANAEALGYNASFVYPKQGGIQTFAAALAARLDRSRVTTSAALDAVDFQRQEVTVSGERMPYSALVSTLPLPELLKRMALPKDIEEHPPALHDPALSRPGHALEAAGGLALGLRAREAVPVLPRGHLQQRRPQHGAARRCVPLRRACGSRTGWRSGGASGGPGACRHGCYCVA
jgi:protoporphyrinogen oxidase